MNETKTKQNKSEKIVKINKRILTKYVHCLPYSSQISEGAMESHVLYKNAGNVLDAIGMFEIARKEIERIGKDPALISQRKIIMKELTGIAKDTQNYWVGALIILELEKDKEIDNIKEIAQQARSHDVKRSAAYTIERNGKRKELEYYVKQLLSSRNYSDSVDIQACKIMFCTVEVILAIRKEFERKQADYSDIINCMTNIKDPWTIGYCIHVLKEHNQKSILRDLEKGAFRPKEGKLSPYVQLMAEIALDKLLEA